MAVIYGVLGNSVNGAPVSGSTGTAFRKRGQFLILISEAAKATFPTWPLN